MPAKQLCKRCGKRPKYGTRHSCAWCWIAREPIELQEAWAAHRRQKAQERPGYVYRARVPERDWEPGTRWCSGCQSLIPLEYADGSRCKACASRARHRSYVERTYNITGEEYDRLLELQGGRCAICNQMPRSKRLAVDHSHSDGTVRGLLCSRCNHDLLGAAHDDVQILKAAVSYLESPPIRRV